MSSLYLAPSTRLHQNLAILWLTTQEDMTAFGASLPFLLLSALLPASHTAYCFEICSVWLSFELLLSIVSFDFLFPPPLINSCLSHLLLTLSWSWIQPQTLLLLLLSFDHKQCTNSYIPPLSHTLVVDINTRCTFSLSPIVFSICKFSLLIHHYLLFNIVHSPCLSWSPVH